MSEPDTDDDGRRDFDFLLGSWQVANRRLADVADPECERWSEFGARAVVRRLLDSLATMDCYSATQFPGSGRMEGITLRLFNPATRLWRIWWASTAHPGDLDTPVEGRFDGSRGEFYCDDVLNGRAVRVRYVWERAAPERPRWTQAFSYDGGATWKPNWIMEFSRGHVGPTPGAGTS